MNARASRYHEAAEHLLRRERVRVRGRRKATTGVAYPDGSVIIPDVRGPISFATAAHEVGHVVLGHSFNGRRLPRWVEEVEAWQYALDQFESYGLAGYDRAYLDAARCVAYAFSKAIRRGVDPETIRERFPGWYSDALAHEKHACLTRAEARARAREYSQAAM